MLYDHGINNKIKQLQVKKRYYFKDTIKDNLSHEISLAKLNTNVNKHFSNIQPTHEYEGHMFKNDYKLSMKKNTVSGVNKTLKRSESFLDKHRHNKRNQLTNHTLYYMHYKYQAGFTNAVKRSTNISQYI